MVVVKSDGKVLVRLKSEADAWAWLQSHQSASVSWACKHEGYSIEKEKKGGE